MSVLKTISTNLVRNDDGTENKALRVGTGIVGMLIVLMVVASVVTILL